MPQSEAARGVSPLTSCSFLSSAESRSFPLESFPFGDEERGAQTRALSPESAVLFCRNLRANEVENYTGASLPYEHAFCVTFARPSQAQVCLEALSAEQELHREEFRTTFLIATQAEPSEELRTASAEELSEHARWQLWTSKRESDLSALIPRIAVRPIGLCFTRRLLSSETASTSSRVSSQLSTIKLLRSDPCVLSLSLVFSVSSPSPPFSSFSSTMPQKRRGSNAHLGEANHEPEKKKVSPGKPELGPADVLCVNTIRCLGADLPTIANSGHPGAPMGMAAMAHALWGYVLRHSGKHPRWFNRDRFILSNGHACALLYSMLHLTGYDMSLEDLRQFRQLNSKTPGHPEVHYAAGIETTTGPLGQGISNAVGVALAGEYMAAKFNKEGFPLFDSHVFVFCGDGCLEEGVASEACSLAGHLGLHRLIVLYDDNNITIDGELNLAFSEKVQQRFKAYDWHVDVVEDGNTDVAGLIRAMENAKERTDKPTLICVRTTIGFLSSKAGTAKVHGSPLSEDELRAVKKQCGLNPEEKLQIPEEVKQFYARVQERGERAVEAWNDLFERYKKEYPSEGKEIERMFSRELRPEVFETLKTLGEKAKEKADSTRAHSGRMLLGIKDFMPELIGGSADLTGSNCTDLKEPSFQVANRAGRYIHFGVREHAMIAMANGLYHFGCMRPFCATFLNFVTYGWGAVRLAALSKCGVLVVATHDSIELGQDGPTHQPIEVLALCRATPNLIAIRPADGTEVAGAYAVWLRDELKRVTVLSLCRSSVPVLQGSSFDGVIKGAYVLSDFENNGKKKVVIAGSGSEVHFCVEAKKLLTNNWDVRLVSMPCWTLFDEQPADYRSQVLCLSERRQGKVLTAYVEAASPFGWEKYFDVHVGLPTFGGSAPAKALYEFFGFSPANIAKRIEEFQAPF
ncbi:UNVERIFIED_CONTAM: transketolase [Hammondia hammondi]|eukprot:XP_008885267.1 transketolase [Hammondia hammondi]